MKRVLTVVFAVALLSFTFPVTGWGAEPCPAVLTEAKTALRSAQATLKKTTQTAKSQEIQAPRAMAGAKSQDIQAPRGQEIQAPRAQDIQAPRGQDIQAPRAMAGAKPGEIQAAQVKKAGGLIREADAACKKGDMVLSAQKAKEALGLLK